MSPFLLRFTDYGLRIRRASYVVVRHMKFHKAQEGRDILALDGATHIWVDQCDFSFDGIVGSKDTYDGLLDIAHGSGIVTSSWNKSWSLKRSLVGHSDSNTEQGRG